MRVSRPATNHLSVTFRAALSPASSASANTVSAAMPGSGGSAAMLPASTVAQIGRHPAPVTASAVSMPSANPRPSLTSKSSVRRITPPTFLCRGSKSLGLLTVALPTPSRAMNVRCNVNGEPVQKSVTRATIAGQVVLVGQWSSAGAKRTSGPLGKTQRRQRRYVSPKVYGNGSVARHIASARLDHSSLSELACRAARVARALVIRI